MSEYINFQTHAQFENLLVNAPDGAILVNTSLLADRNFTSDIVVGSDFDGTASTFEGGQMSSWQEVKRIERGLISQAGEEKMEAGYQTWGQDTTYEGQVAWANDSYSIYHEEGVTRRQFEEVGRTIRLREGFIEVAGQVIKRHSGLTVVTYAMSAIVEPCLKQNGLHVAMASNDLNSSIMLYAEQSEFESDEPDAVLTKRGVKENTPRVLGANKHEYMEQFARLRRQDPTSIVYIGDALVDLKAKGLGRGILLHHRENQHYTPTSEEAFRNCEFILVGHTLSPLKGLLEDFNRPQFITVR